MSYEIKKIFNYHSNFKNIEENFENKEIKNQSKNESQLRMDEELNNDSKNESQIELKEEIKSTKVEEYDDFYIEEEMEKSKKRIRKIRI